MSKTVTSSFTPLPLEREVLYGRPDVKFYKVTKI